MKAAKVVFNPSKSKLFTKEQLDKFKNDSETVVRNRIALSGIQDKFHNKYNTDMILILPKDKIIPYEVYIDIEELKVEIGVIANQLNTDFEIWMYNI